MITLDVLELIGSRKEMGHVHGEHLRDRIEAFVDMRFDNFGRYLADRGGRFDMRALLRIADESMAVHREWHAAGVEEHEAIARAANIDVTRLYLATNMTDMRDALLLGAASGPKLSKSTGEGEGCTSIMVPAQDDRAALGGQTWDLNPPDVAFVTAFLRKPDDAPEAFAVTCVGCLSLMGMNAHGVAFGTTNIKTYGAKSGVGYLGLLHRNAEAESASQAAEWVTNAPLAAAHTYWACDEHDQIEVEVSPNGAERRESEDNHAIWRTNHCLGEQHCELEGEVVSESSRKRFSRVESSITSLDSVAAFKALFSNRDDGVHSINRHEEDDQGTATNAVLIAEPAARRVHACRGRADIGEWVTHDFS